MVVCVGGVEWGGQLYACHGFVREGVGAGGVDSRVTTDLNFVVDVDAWGW